MAEVTIIRRWGSHAAGEKVDVTDIEAKWLIGNHYASEDGSEDAARAGARAPGTYGSDFRTGGDLSRGGGMQSVRAQNRRDGENETNRAARVAGAPLAGGPRKADPKAAEASGEKSEDELRAEGRTEAMSNSGSRRTPSVPEQKPSDEK